MKSNNIIFKCYKCDRELTSLNRESSGRCYFTEYYTVNLQSIINDLNNGLLIDNESLEDAIFSGDYDSDSIDTDYDDHDIDETEYRCPHCRELLRVSDLFKETKQDNNKMIKFLMKK